jgi:hypothetical protein
MHGNAMPTPPATATGRHRATWWDRLAIILLGIAGCALSYDALRQMATAVHIRHQLTYLFPVVIDGFIAYGVRALLVLHQAPLPARLYAWTLFIAATAASIWANGLHALDLNQPGTVTLHLDDTTVAVLSAIAPLALAGATHLHILITRYGGTPAETTTPSDVQDRPQPAPAQAAQVPYTDPTAGRSPRTNTSTPIPGDETNSPTEDDCHDVPDEVGQEAEPEPERIGQDPHEGSGPVPPPVANSGGRPALASITELAQVISAAHPDGSGLTRDSARKAIADAGLGAGTERLAEAMTLARQRSAARQHPGN